MLLVSCLLLTLGCRTGKLGGDDSGIGDAGPADGGGSGDGGSSDGGGSDGGTGDGGATLDRAWSWGLVGEGDADLWLIEEAEGSLRQTRLASPGDMGGDGSDELAIGAPFHEADDQPVGRVYLLSGTGAGPELDLASLPGLRGEPEGPRLGDLASLGDLDGDGLAELGASTGAEGGTTWSFLLWGGGPATTAALPLFEADVGFSLRDGGGGEAELELLPWAGDHTGDGQPDLVATSPTDTTFVLSAAELVADTRLPDAAWAQVVSTEHLRILGSGDMDGDGLADLLFSDAGGYAGVYMLPGGTAPEDSLETSAQILVLPESRESIEASLLPDLDGDGDAELLLTDGDQTHGLCLGRPDLPLWTSIDQCEVQLPAGAGAGVGDLDGDGLQDLALRVEAVTTATDWLVLYFGREAWPEGFAPLPPDVTLLSGAAGTQMGALPGPDQQGDLDGDGLDDLLLADPEAAPGGRIDAGEVRVLRGRRSWEAELLLDAAELRVQGGAAGAGLGEAAVFADLDGDGRDDLVVTEGPADDGSQPGRVLVFLGQPLP